MKFLLAGDWHSNIHEEACARALESLGHQVSRFPWFGYFRQRTRSGERLSHILGRAQNKLLFGPLVWKLNEHLVKAVEATRPDVVFIYRGTHIFPRTLCHLKRRFPGLRLASYNNDNPFTHKSWLLWRHFLRGLPHYDIHFVYRPSNIADYKGLGLSNVHLLMPYYIRERNYRLLPSPDERAKFECDVVFVGHYERDGRERYIEALLRNGINVRVCGPEWERALARSPFLAKIGPIRMAWDDDYNKALSAAKIALCLFSRLNGDVYSRRCFEIPAVGTMMLAPYTQELATMFVPDQEAVYFRGMEELVEKAKYYIDNDAERERIALAGHRKVVEAGHDVVSRMRQMVSILENQFHEFNRLS